MTSHEYARKLADVADLLAAAPEFELPAYMNHYVEENGVERISFHFEKDLFIAAVKAIGSGKKVFVEDRLEFATEGLRLVIYRDSVCKIVKPAQPAEYECEPLLSQEEVSQNMTQQEWLEAAKLPVLRELIANWHPSAHVPQGAIGPITAPGAEVACEQVRKQIQQEEPADPVVRWDAALKAGDIGELTMLLDDVWFGVPESTSCWSIPGFSEAVTLLDDPPNDSDIDGNPHQTGCICADCSRAELTADND